ncbi:NAD(P)/FAD-dependent oxidoreductase [Paenalcaligenes hominis]|uniref:NAD(P)/FAD-dependent oxidoreductase n=1 Tax=Paenalcaligenes hominis TaxID=643674 RepID=UPI00352680A2
MITNEKIVIVGAGHAGGTVAALLRQHGVTSAITLIGDEPFLPYQRPPLSKGWLQGHMSENDLLLKPAAFYEQKDIQCVTGVKVIGVNHQKQELHLNNGETVSYGHLILACGAQARKLDVEGSQLKGVYSLRTMRDAEKIRTALKKSQHLVIIGGGFIGLELAAFARGLGIKVTLLEREDRLLKRLASSELSEHLAQLHQANGVDIRYNVQVQELVGQTDVQGVELHQAGVIACDTVLVGIGSSVDLSLALQANLQCEQGVIVDATAQTSQEHISAIGDMTQRPVLGLTTTLRLESVPSALEQAKQVALRLAGKAAPAPEVPWFWSDQYDSKIQVAGLIQNSEKAVVCQDPDSGGFSVLHFAKSCLVAVECVQAPRNFMMARKAIAQAKPIDLNLFNYAETPLASVLQ